MSSVRNIVMLDKLDNFNITQILESGQVFRFDKISNHSYILNAKQTLIKITQQHQDSNIMFYNANASELDEIWVPYFDLDTNYKEITSILKNKDEHMKAAVEFGEGIRILKQDPWEMLISFIISQNKAIPHIKQCIRNICEKFGTPLEPISGSDRHYYTFPTPKELSRATEQELRDCKVGFRAAYIMDACHKVMNGDIILNDLFIMETDKARDILMTIKGVGPKVADCILLFAYGKTEVFPTDVWIKRIIEGLYFDGRDVPMKEIQQFAKDYFGDLAGYAQQYLFYYARENSLFKKEKPKKSEVK